MNIFIDPSTLVNALKAPKTLVVDVRTYDFGEGGSLIGAINIPVDALEVPENLVKFSGFDTIICYCAYS